MVVNEAEEQQSPALMYPVVGFGASAGGLQAFKEVLENLNPTTGMAFVLVTHLAPDQKSFLSEIVERYTQMPVHSIEDGQPANAQSSICVASQPVAHAAGRLLSHRAAIDPRSHPAHHRHLFPFPGRRPEESCHRRGSVRGGCRWRSRSEGHQGGRRHRHRPKPRHGDAQRHAAQFHRRPITWTWSSRPPRSRGNSDGSPSSSPVPKSVPCRKARSRRMTSSHI